MTILKLEWPKDSPTQELTFSHEEAQLVEFQPQQKFILKYRQDRSPYVHLVGAEWDRVTCVFHPLLATSDNLETLRAVTDAIALTLYYSTGAVAETLDVEVDPNVELYYRFGTKDAERMPQVVFFETSK